MAGMNWSLAGRREQMRRQGSEDWREHELPRPLIAKPMPAGRQVPFRRFRPRLTKQELRQQAEAAFTSFHAFKPEQSL
jgi:hypothetical protein